MSTKLAPIAFISQPTSTLVWQFLNRRDIFGRVHALLQQCEFPDKSERQRVDIEIREKVNPGNYIRKANLYELLGLAVTHGKEILEYLPLEGHDEFTEEMGRAIGVNLTIPILSFSGGLAQVDLARAHRQNDARHIAVITSMRRA